jgi:hypothetical protein
MNQSHKHPSRQKIKAARKFLLAAQTHAFLPFAPITPKKNRMPDHLQKTSQLSCTGMTKQAVRLPGMPSHKLCQQEILRIFSAPII